MTPFLFRRRLMATMRIRRDRFFSNRNRRLGIPLFLPVFCLSAVIVLTTNFARAQGLSRVLPADDYMGKTLGTIQNGDFDDAGKQLEFLLRNSVKMQNQGRWLDSLCYYAQIGECHYHLGALDDALEAYSAALNIYLENYDWFKSIRYGGNPAVPQARKPAPWGVSQRTVPVGSFPKNCFNIRREMTRAFALGQDNIAITDQKVDTPIHAQEIARSIALAIRRRAEILGPLSKYDAINKTLSETLGGRPCNPDSFASCWVGVLYGLALVAMDDDQTALREFNSGLLMEKRFDHHLTAIALYEMGNISLRQGKNEEALNYFYEAAYSAWVYGDAILVGDSFRKMADTHRLIDKSKPCEAVLAVRKSFLDARANPPKTLAVTLDQEAAEEQLMFGDVREAMSILSGAERTMGKSAIVRTRYGAKNQYLLAWANYMLAYMVEKDNVKRLGEGHKYFDEAMQFYRRGSLPLWQLGNLVHRYRTNQISSRGLSAGRANEIFEKILSDPDARDWTLAPQDAMARTMFTPPEAYESWFKIAVQRDDKEKAFEIAELACRQRFYMHLPQGPRILALRLLFEGNPEDIPKEILTERQSLAIDFTLFAKYSERAKVLRRELATIPAVPNTKAQADKQKELLGELQTVSGMQEAMLYPIALTRTKSTNIFPPVLKIERLRESLPEKTAILVFFDVESEGELYGFLLDRRQLLMWPIINNDPRADTIHTLIVNYLKALGCGNATRALTSKELGDNQKWRETGNVLLDRLLGGVVRQADFTELVIVPTRLLWYTPFESMCTSVNGKLLPLISAGEQPLTIRYAPTPSLAVPTGKGRPATLETVTVYGRVGPKKEDARTTLDAISRFAQGGLKLALIASDPADQRYAPLPASAAAYASQIRQLLVLDDIPQPRAGPLDWSPFTQDKNRGTNSVVTWLQLPWGGPRLIVLPAFHTPAETALQVNKSQSNLLGNGDELFVSTMLLEACGAQTVLVSRWRSGGRTSLELVGDFLKEYPKAPANEAWRRAVLRVITEDLVPEDEPRIRLGTKKDEALLSNHPFFWASFLLVDRGELPGGEEADQGGKEADGGLE